MLFLLKPSSARSPASSLKKMRKKKQAQIQPTHGRSALTYGMMAFGHVWMPSIGLPGVGLERLQCIQPFGHSCDDTKHTHAQTCATSTSSEDTGA